MSQDPIARFLVPPPPDEFDLALGELDSVLESAVLAVETKRSGGGVVVSDDSDCEGCKI